MLTQTDTKIVRADEIKQYDEIVVGENTFLVVESFKSVEWYGAAQAILFAEENNYRYLPADYRMHVRI